ncbi:G-type lectin S-receptor-like serine/threonine-protein kinase SD3-1 [Chenopodium quinoa]|uniref:G-type lectin S-receptor-like serine/threonine-protein kinase SD3-1 n=1 Tax=Chenopodium quinoa TaxID=63459 RepID=UPI000B76EC99|nr:G-type lectin S-receptor-like serine/threonine-protein kinase SD3-1 [Chenopodium quinoa]
MLAIWANQLNHGTPVKHFQGKSSKVQSFISLYASVALFVDVFILLGFTISGVCEEVGKASVPLGFEVSGFDKTTTWVSQNGVFSFGFLEGGYLTSINDDNNDGVYVGIRYNLGNKVANLPVWTVGGGLRVSENSTFRLSEDGRLVLFENTNGLILWSSNTSKLGVQKASLLDDGNLVLLNNQDEVVWQSFNSPTSSLLPRQSFHFPQSLRAPSTKSISSYYNFVIRPSGELALVWESNVTYWKSGGALSSPSPISTKAARFDSDGILGVFDATNKSIWSISSKDFQDSSVSLRHLRIDSDGNLRIYSWFDELKKWKVGWQAVENQCDVFGSCGLYSLCGFNATGPVCNCLHEGTIDGGSGSTGSDLSISGCKKLVDLSNCKMRTSMMVLKHTALYGLYPPHDFDVMLNEDNCKAYCSNDTSCIAATSKNDGSGLCTVKRTSFISGYNYPSLAAVSFLKVCLVPQAVSARNANPQGEGTANLLSSGRIIAHASAGKFVTALGLIGLATALVTLTLEILVWFVYHRQKDTVLTRIPFNKDAKKNPQYSALVRLSFEEIKELTSDFATQLGPSIFQGILPNQTPIIVKSLINVVVSEKDFRAAVSILGGTHHRNLVAVKGFCCDQKYKFLIYEFVPCGSLDKWLFDSERNTNELHLQERLNIALGVARGLAYLHLECQSCVAHGNLKLENVMLDQNLVPKLMDFGLQGIFQEEAGSSSESASERDIYKFGHMLLQITRVKRNPSLNDDVNRLISEIVETHGLEGRDGYESVERVVRIALWCVQTQPFLRPSIGEVVKVLEGTLSVDRPPSIFAFRAGQQIEAEEHNEIQELP